MDRITLVFEPSQEGGFSAYVAEIPGANSQGETIEEAKRMVLESLHELLEYRRAKARQTAVSGTTYEQVAFA